MHMHGNLLTRYSFARFRYSYNTIIYFLAICKSKAYIYYNYYIYYSAEKFTYYILLGRFNLIII